MDRTEKCFCLLSVAIFLTAGIEAQSCTKCGDSGQCCKYDEICETKVNGGTCYKAADKVTCNYRYYCYKPTTCCGFGTCCRENSKCCGYRCCRSGYRCNGNSCEIENHFDWWTPNFNKKVTEQPFDRNFDWKTPVFNLKVTTKKPLGRSSYSSYTFRWYYILFAIIPLTAVCGAVSRRMIYRRALAASGRNIQRNDFQPESTSSANLETASASTFDAPPPCYEDIVTNTGIPDSMGGDANHARILKPPSYIEVVSQPSRYAFRYAGTSPQSTESVDPNKGTAGYVNPSFQTEPSGNSVPRT